MGWRDIGIGGGSGGANWLKVKAGEKVMVHVLSEEPHSFNNHFFQSIQRGAVCPGEGCPACALKDKEHRPRWQHAMLVYSYNDKACKVWVMTNTVAEQVKNIYDTYKSLAKVDLAVSRTGSGLETKYGIVPFGTKWKEAMTPADVPVLEDLLKPVAPEVIEQMLAGIDPSTEFEPSKLEGAAPAGEAWDEPAPAVRDAEEASSNAEPAADEWGNEPTPTVEEPVEEEPKPEPKKLAPAKAPAQPANERLDLIKKVLHKFATHPKMKAPGAKEKVVLQVAKTKKTVSQLSVDELKKVLSLLK